MYLPLSKFESIHRVSIDVRCTKSIYYKTLYGHHDDSDPGPVTRRKNLLVYVRKVS